MTATGPSAPGPSAPDAGAVVDLQGVSVVYGRQLALRDVSASFPAGAVGLLGPNGAGKSTMLKALLGFIAPTQGRMRVLGLDVTTSALDIRSRIGYMPETDAHIPGMSAVQFVAYCGQLAGLPDADAMQRAHEVLYYVGLGEARYRNLETYSTGMKQRIKLAQAIVHDPPVLLLDEPTSGLDPAGRDAMLRLLLELGRDFGKSLIVSTHLLADVETVCEQVVILMNGQVRGQGTVAELCARRQDRYRLQVQGDSAGFKNDMTLAGVQIVADNERGDLRVTVPEGWNARTFFAIASTNDLTLRGVVRDDETLEELFLRTVKSA